MLGQVVAVRWGKSAGLPVSSRLPDLVCQSLAWQTLNEREQVGLRSRLALACLCLRNHGSVAIWLDVRHCCNVSACMWAEAALQLKRQVSGKQTWLMYFIDCSCPVAGG